MNIKLFVGNLSDNTTVATLRELFGQAGTVKSVTRPVDRSHNQMRNFAFVEMATAAEAAKAIEMLNGRLVDEKEIKVSEARAQERGTAKGLRGGFPQGGFPQGGGHHGHDQFIRGDTRSGSSHRGRG